MGWTKGWVKGGGGGGEIGESWRRVFPQRFKFPSRFSRPRAALFRPTDPHYSGSGDKFLCHCFACERNDKFRKAWAAQRRTRPADELFSRCGMSVYISGIIIVIKPPLNIRTEDKYNIIHRHISYTIILNQAVLGNGATLYDTMCWLVSCISLALTAVEHTAHNLYLRKQDAWNVTKLIQRS